MSQGCPDPCSLPYKFPYENTNNTQRRIGGREQGVVLCVGRQRKGPHQIQGSSLTHTRTAQSLCCELADTSSAVLHLLPCTEARTHKKMQTKPRHMAAIVYRRVTINTQQPCPYEIERPHTACERGQTTNRCTEYKKTTTAGGIETEEGLTTWQFPSARTQSRVCVPVSIQYGLVAQRCTAEPANISSMLGCNLPPPTSPDMRCKAKEGA